MAIDRLKAYRKTWTNDVGWNMTFDIIPSGDALNPLTNIEAVTYIPLGRSIININSHKASFDKIPFGTLDAASIEVEFDFLELPDNLKEILKNPFYDQSAHIYEGVYTTNLFILKSDRGTGGVSEYVEFLGGQKATLSNKYTIRKNPVTNDFETQNCTVEAVDIMKLIFEQVSTAEWAAQILARPADVYLKTIVQNVHVHDWSLGTNPMILKIDFESSGSQSGLGGAVGTALKCQCKILKRLFTDGLQYAIYPFLSVWTRFVVPSAEITVMGSPITALTFYKQGRLVSHAKGDALTDEEVLSLAVVLNDFGANSGMLNFDKSGESYLEYPYLWDLLKNLCEGLCCKLTYKPTTFLDGSDKRYTYDLAYTKIFENTIGGIDLTDRFADAQEGDLDFTPCSGVYTSVTAEIPSTAEPDIAEFEAQITGTQSDERINVKMIHHNLQTAGIDSSQEIHEPRIHLRKLYYAETDSTTGLVYPLKVHESVTIDDGIDATDYDDVIAMPGRLAYNHYSDPQRNIDAQTWAIATQVTNGLPFAVSNFYLNRFSLNSQNEITCTMFMKDGETMPENCGDLVSIPTIDGFAGSELATMIEMEANWQTGTVDITFITRG